MNNISVADTGFKHIIEPRKFIEVVANVSAYTAAPEENVNWLNRGGWTGLVVGIILIVINIY
jgi:hypothetical protein